MVGLQLNYTRLIVSSPKSWVYKHYRNNKRSLLEVFAEQHGAAAISFNQQTECARTTIEAESEPYNCFSITQAEIDLLKINLVKVVYL